MLRTAVLPTLLALLVSPLALSFQQDAKHAPADTFETLLHRGFELHQKNDYTAAIPLLRDAWKLQPHDYFANLLLGIDLLRTGQVKDSISFLREAARQKPQEEFAFEYMGEAYAALGDHAEAFHSFQGGITAAPASPDAKSALVGYCLARFGDLSAQMRSSTPGLAAEYRLQALSRPKTDPSRVELLQRAAALSDDPENWAQLALTQIAEGNISAGGDALERARKLAPGYLDVLEADALVSATAGDWIAAAKSLNAINTRSPAALSRMLPDWPVRLAPEATQPISEAAAAFMQCVVASCTSEALLQKLPKSPEPPHTSAADYFREQRWESVARLAPPPTTQKEAWFQRGVALAEMGDCDRAVPALERSLGPTDWAAPAMFHLSQCYAWEADRQAALLAKSGNNDAIVHMMRGDVLLRLQANSKAAVEEYQAAVAARPDDPAVWERLAEAQLSAGATEDARRSAGQALKLDSHRTGAMRTLAQAAMQERKYTEALPYLRELARQNPRDLSTRVQLATACSQTGALDDALKNLDSALKEGYPDEKGSLHYQLGTILRGLGRTDEAKQAFAEAKQLSDKFQSTSLRDKGPRE